MEQQKGFDENDGAGNRYLVLFEGRDIDLCGITPWRSKSSSIGVAFVFLLVLNIIQLKKKYTPQNYFSYLVSIYGAILSDTSESLVGEAHSCPLCWRLSRSRAKPTVLGSGEQVPPTLQLPNDMERERGQMPWDRASLPRLKLYKRSAVRWRMPQLPHIIDLSASRQLLHEQRAILASCSPAAYEPNLDQTACRAYFILHLLSPFNRNKNPKYSITDTAQSQYLKEPSNIRWTIANIIAHHVTWSEQKQSAGHKYISLIIASPHDIQPRYA